MISKTLALTATRQTAETRCRRICKLKAKLDMKIAHDILRSTACYLVNEARTNCPNQEHADALNAGAMALASLAAELRAGGATDASDDFMQRAMNSATSHCLRANNIPEDTQE